MILCGSICVLAKLVRYHSKLHLFHGEFGQTTCSGVIMKRPPIRDLKDAHPSPSSKCTSLSVILGLDLA
jgi:hypothetical protein